VLASYRHEFRYMTISTWNRDRLREIGSMPSWCRRGSISRRFHDRENGPRREDMVLALGRTHPLKNFPLTLAAWRALG
jgi:hypothetical protein